MSTLLELRTRARRRADAVGNNFFSDAEVDDYINIGLGELHDILVQKFEDYYVKSVAFNLASGQTTYLFSSIGLSDFYKLLGVDAAQGNDTVRVRRFSFPDRNTYQSDESLFSSKGYSNYEYSVRDNHIEFIPEPGSTEEITLWYVPSFSKLVSDSATVDSRIATNWEEYAVIVAAIKMLQKEETSTGALERDLERISARIEQAAGNRDAAEPFGITDETVGTVPYYRWGV